MVVGKDVALLGNNKAGAAADDLANAPTCFLRRAGVSTRMTVQHRAKCGRRSIEIEFRYKGRSEIDRNSGGSDYFFDELFFETTRNHSLFLTSAYAVKIALPTGASKRSDTNAVLLAFLNGLPVGVR